MPKRPKSKPPQGPFSWIRRPFRRACVNLCTPDNGWNHWGGFSFKNSQGKTIEFDYADTTEEKVAFLDLHLALELSGKGEGGERGERKDLNIYREWLLKHLCRQIARDAEDWRTGLDQARAYILPEDLPKILADVRLYHNHIRGPGTSLTEIDDLNILRDKTSPFRAKNFITPDELAHAHKTYLGTEAKLLTDPALPDGTIVVQPLTEAASIAYGSPEWCTAYRNGQTHFKEYAEDLLILIKPSGDRYQFHFREMQFMDGDDKPVDIVSLCDEVSGLFSVLKPYIRKEIKRTARAPENHEIEENIVLLRLAHSHPELHKEAAPLAGATFLDIASEDPNALPPNASSIFGQIASPIPAWKTAVLKAIQQEGNELYLTGCIPAAQADKDWMKMMKKFVGFHLLMAFTYPPEDILTYLRVVSRVPEICKTTTKDISNAAATVIGKEECEKTFFTYCATIPVWEKAIARDMEKLYDKAYEMGGLDGLERLEKTLACSATWTQRWKRIEAKLSPQATPTTPPPRHILRQDL